jgi:hypothetical protein
MQEIRLEEPAEVLVAAEASVVELPPDLMVLGHVARSFTQD